MVQGWESRADLANKRREEARQRKQARKGPKAVTGNTVINYLLSHDMIPPNYILQAWIKSDDGGKAVCSAHFRSEACQLRKCKFSHAFTVSTMKGLECAGSADGSDTEPAMFRLDNISLLAPEEYQHLCFLFVDGMCIYDHANPTTWKCWSDTDNARRKAAASTVPLASILEHCDDADDLSVAMDINIRLNENDAGLKSIDISALLKLPAQALLSVLYFADGKDLCSLHSCCTALSEMIDDDDELADEREEFLSTHGPKELSAKELSKLRKHEKKKKIKSANSKAKKNGGHKKVKMCRR